MFDNEIFFYNDKEDGLFAECKYCYLEENDKTVKEIVNHNGLKILDTFQKCIYCGNIYYRDEQVDKMLENYKKAKDFDKIRWL